MGYGLTLVTTIITVVGTLVGTVLAALIAAYFQYFFRRRKTNDGSIPDESQQATRDYIDAVNEHSKIDAVNEHPKIDAVGNPTGTDSMETASQLPIQRTKPWGHPDQGQRFDHRGFDGIKTIEIGCGDWIDSLRIQYKKDSNLVWTLRAGGMGGSIQNVDLEDGEYITEIMGSHGTYLQTGIINSLTFISNTNKKFGPYGRIDHRKESKQNHFSVSGGKIVGFHGTEGNYISSIGFYMLLLV